MKINIVYNKNILNYENTLLELKTLLAENKTEFQAFELSALENFGEFTIVIGGDGTLLKAARFYAAYNVPVFGINLGRLGFLSQKAGIDEVTESVLNKKFSVEKRMMLVSDERLALNDFVIKGCDTSRTSKIYLEINGTEVCDYIADGLIISTPTGSTAYGLSAGGPVIHPSMEAITIVPICPHTLTARPLVVPSSEEITVKTGDKPLCISIDGYDASECVEKITIKSAPQKALLAFLKNERFYSVLRNKLHWGISPEG